MYGLSGASRTGKTTLAKALSVHMGCPYVDSSTTAIAAKAGFNMVGNLSIEERIQAQEILLNGYMELILENGPVFITDRTPIDMLAYTLAEVTMHSCGPELGQRISQYGKRCVELTEKTFALVFMVDPLPNYESQPDKPPPNKAYQEHIHLLIMGALTDSQIPTMFVDAGSVEQRVAGCMLSLGRFLETTKQEHQQEIFH